MYELLKLLSFAGKKSEEGNSLVWATIIRTVGSAYRKKGTQMIVADDLTFEGAISGGCVENEVLRYAQKVFATRENVIFEYDGRYKLGCIGKIYVLIEYLQSNVLQQISLKVSQHYKTRKTFYLGLAKDDLLARASMYFLFDKERLNVSEPVQSHAYNETEELEMQPQHQLIIIGGEHDSVVLANMADHTGMATWLITKESFLCNLRSTIKVAYLKPEELSAHVHFDEHTAIILMSHSLSRDLSYLIETIKVRSAYLGILGPESRKQIILNDLMNYNENIFLTYQEKLQTMHGPIGLKIGAKTPEDISISILSEIIGIFNR